MSFEDRSQPMPAATMEACHLVAIGAPAAMDATDAQHLRTLIHAVQRRGDMVFLLAGAPHHASQGDGFGGLGGGSLNVVVATHGEEPRPDSLYLCPPGSAMELDGGRLVLRPGAPGAAPGGAAGTTPLDSLFRSVAAAHGGRAVGVLFPGGDGDGLAGALAIRDAGGLVLIHAPDGPDRSQAHEALTEAGCTGVSGTAEQLASFLNRFESCAAPAKEQGRFDAAAFTAVLELVSQTTGLDLSQYKENTLRRQTERRYRSLGFKSLGDYVQHARGQPDELYLLQQYYMISVSSFFRDPVVFSELEKALRQLIAGKKSGDPIRVWVPACATGEEAYSIAMLLASILGERLKNFHVRVFATDIDQDALEFARAGTYAPGELAHIDPERRERWFCQHGSGWRIVKEVRELCVFSAHDVIRHPPFINMDLVSCRNLLIYFKAEQQGELLNTFHYAIKPDGLLLLGKSESVGFNSRLFEPIDAGHKLYRRRAATAQHSTRFVSLGLPAAQTQPVRPRYGALTPRQSLVEQAHAALAREYGPTGVLVNENFEPLHFFGRTQKYLALPEANADFSVFSLCPTELRSELKALGYRMLQEGLPVLHGSGVQLQRGEEQIRVKPVLRRIVGTREHAELGFLISFEETMLAGGDIPAADIVSNADHCDEINRLQQELADTREHLQAVIEALEASNEELQSLNEELQSSSEELQSSNEELQSSNEELTTLNDELRIKSIESAQLNTTLSNIQNSIRTGLVVVDQDGRVTRFNALAVRVFGLVPSDMGQPLHAVPCHLDLPRLRWQISDVIEQERSVVERVHQGDFHYLMQIDPYRGDLGEGAGAVLTFTDISDLHRAELARLSSDVRFRHVWQASINGLLLVDAEGRIEMATPSLEAMFGYDAGELIGQALEQLVPEMLQEQHRAWREAFLGTQDPLRTAFVMRGIEGRRKDGSQICVEVSLSRMSIDGDGFVLASVADVTERKRAEAALRESEAKLSTILDNVDACIYIKDRNYRYVYANGAVARLLGVEMDQLLGRDDLELYEADSAQRLRANDQRVIEQGEKIEIEELIVHRHSGVARTYLSAKLPLRREDGSIYALVGISSDITERQCAESRLRLAASVFTHAQEGIMITDTIGNLVDVNETFTSITGYTRDEVIGRNARLLSSGRQSAEFYAAMWRSLRTLGSWQGELWNRRKTGEVYAELLNIASVRGVDEQTQYYVALFSDITLQKEHQRQLEQVAHYDQLTGLPNRVLLAERLQHAIIRARRRGNLIAVVYLDLDGFKAVNDSHGHDVGDELLVAISRRFKDVLREGDTLARLGGDEFVAVLIDLENPVDCEIILTRLLHAASAPVRLRDMSLQVSASLGVTLYPQDGSDPDTLLRHADQAMYQAKHAGKNHYYLFDPERDRQARSHWESLQYITQSLERREFVLHYQPKVNMRSGELIGVEALVRWQHPLRGLLTPDQFLPLIEDHELIVQLGDWVLDAALDQMLLWRQQGLDISVSVNIAARHLQRDDFLPRLRCKLHARPALQAGRLELEVLETAALADVNRVARVIDDCRTMGVSFALDDFGTGYSSLTYLKRLPASTLKMDRSFVRDMLWDTEDLAIIEGVIGLAGAFRRKVIAEGVESAEHGELLLRLGCELAQGYCIAWPMAGEALPDWLSEWRPAPSWAGSANRLLDGDQLPLVYAEVELRHWSRTLMGYLNGSPTSPEALDLQPGRFETWYRNEGQARYGALPAFQALITLHAEVSTLGRDLAMAYLAGRHADAQAGLQRFQLLQHQLLEQLHALAPVANSARRV